jgi:hypothetical protein
VTWSAANANYRMRGGRTFGRRGLRVEEHVALELQKARDLFIVPPPGWAGFIVCDTVAVGVANLL